MFRFCFHKWVILKSIPVKFVLWVGIVEDKEEFLLQCEKCGKIKKKIL